MQPWIEQIFGAEAIHDFLPLLCEANGLGNHRGDFNSLPEASFWNLPLWKVLHGWFASKPTKWIFFSNLEFWTILVGIATLRHLFLPLTLGPCECPTHQYLFDPTFLFPRDPPSHLGLLLCKLSMESFVEIGKVLTRCTSLIEICTFTFTWGWFHSKFKE